MRVRIGRFMKRETRVPRAYPCAFIQSARRLLDPADSLALRLVQNGDRLPTRIIETPERYMIEWDMAFRIDGDAFISLDSTGREQAIVGYPIAEISHAMARARVQ